MPGFELNFVLRQGAFTVEIGERIDARALALFGPSGSGKTTIIEAIAGLRTPQDGAIAIAGHELFAAARGINLPARERRVGYVPQDVLLFPHMTVRDNVLYGVTRSTNERGHPHRHASPYTLAHVMELLELEELMPRGVASLSGGERQRVALARALMSSPDVLLLDEPMAAVDLPRRRRILAALIRIRSELKLPLVYVAHSPDEVAQIADWVLVIDAGRVTERGTPSAVLA